MSQDLFEMARQDHQAGNLPEAELLYQHVIEREPNNADAIHLLGILYGQSDRSERAAEMFRRALAIKPQWPEAHSNLGNVLQALGQYPQSIAAYQQALSLRPNFPECLSNFSNALRSCGEFDQAIAAARKALELRPAYPKAYVNLGLAYQGKGDQNQAIAAYQKALALQPDLAEAHANLGTALNLARRVDEAIVACREAIRLRPNLADAHLNLGNALESAGRLEESLAAYDRARRLNPANITAQSNRLFAMSYQPDLDPAEIVKEAKLWDAGLPRAAADHANNRDPERRLKIGYVSPDFARHCQSFFTIPLLGHHDHTQFEIYAYANVAKPDELTQRIGGYCDVWRSTVGLSDEQVSRQIREDGIDILVDLTMHMGGGRPLLFARKPAPIQVAWLAYPGTTGLSAMDYRLTDPYLDPPGEHDDWYSEKSIRLPETFWCYDPLSDRPEVNELAAMKNGYVTFGCLNNFCKVTDPTLSVWSKVLKALPGSRLILLSPQGEHRRRVLSRLDVELGRVEFVEFQPRDRYLQTYHRIDLCLDTFPYNGHTTSLDALWMGVPVMSMEGQAAVARAGISQNSNLGLAGELVGRGPEEFVSLTVSLAGNLARLSELRKTLRARMSGSALMDGARFARNIEGVYRDIWRRWAR
ncbi:MAG: tetratricopeptide repeat protein [Tepidisphaeraceae bacterium]|jgi:predicted O-linked N-acetylglucosamine transferase (SPINDLY family)